jgi:CheY-like chemotaxis protein
MIDPREILLVEDNDDDAFLFERSFRAVVPACQLERVADGREALRFMEQRKGEGRHPALLLLDLQLPYFTGFDVLARLREDETWRFLPVVIFSSSTQPRDVTRAYELGANSYLVKPADLEDLRVLVETTCRYWLDLNRPPTPVLAGASPKA